ncbi:MAG: DUF6204 family protein [Quadrisphaera sp.]
MTHQSTEPATASRTYRTEVVGQFARPNGELRARLLADQSAHDVFSSAFTEDGCWTYGPTLTRFTVRHLLTVRAASAVEADEDARTEAVVRAMALLEENGVAWRGDLNVSVTCLEDLKPRR